MLTKKLLFLLIFAVILGSISFNYIISKETLYASANLLKGGVINEKVLSAVVFVSTFNWL